MQKTSQKHPLGKAFSKKLPKQQIYLTSVIDLARPSPYNASILLPS
jgi:hypothetical protein